MSTAVTNEGISTEAKAEHDSSCSCCWGRKIKPQTKMEISYPRAPLHRSQGRSDIFSASTANLARDANEVYNLNIDGVEKPTHFRQITTYPQEEKK